MIKDDNNFVFNSGSIGGYPNGYECLKAEYYDFEEVKENSMYKVGDKVKIIKKIHGHHFNIGDIVTIKVCEGDYSMLGEIENCVAWWIRADEVVPVKEPATQNYPKITIRVDGNKTIAKMYQNGINIKTAEAKCSPEDKFDYETGIALAVGRLFSKQHQDICEGDKVRIVDCGKSYTTYSEWIVKNCKDKAVFYKYGQIAENGTTGTVIKIAPHLSCKKAMLYYIDSGMGYYLTDRDGIEKL